MAGHGPYYTDLLISTPTKSNLVARRLEPPSWLQNANPMLPVRCNPIQNPHAAMSPLLAGRGKLYKHKLFPLGTPGPIWA